MSVPPLGFTFDFNGTLSDDEPIMYAVFAELFAGLGRPLSEADYRDRLAGLSDEAIISSWMGERDDLAELVARRVAAYRARVDDGSTVSADVRAAVRLAADRVPLAVVSGATAAEIHPVLAAAGLSDAFTGGDLGRRRPPWQARSGGIPAGAAAAGKRRADRPGPSGGLRGHRGRGGVGHRGGADVHRGVGHPSARAPELGATGSSRAIDLP